MRTSEKWTQGCRQRRNEALKCVRGGRDDFLSALWVRQGHSPLILRLHILLICSRLPCMGPPKQSCHYWKGQLALFIWIWKFFFKSNFTTVWHYLNLGFCISGGMSQFSILSSSKLKSSMQVFTIMHPCIASSTEKPWAVMTIDVLLNQKRTWSPCSLHKLDASWLITRLHVHHSSKRYSLCWCFDHDGEKHCQR